MIPEDLFIKMLLRGVLYYFLFTCHMSELGSFTNNVQVHALLHVKQQQAHDITD